MARIYYKLAPFKVAASNIDATDSLSRESSLVKSIIILVFVEGVAAFGAIFDPFFSFEHRHRIFKRCHLL